MSTPPAGPPSDPYRRPDPDTAQPREAGPPGTGQYGPPGTGQYGPPPGQPQVPPGYPSQPYGAQPPAPGPDGAPPPGAEPPGAEPYSAQAYGTQPEVRPTTDDRPLDGVSVAGLVLAFLIAPLGLVLSIVGLARTGGGRRRGRGLAIAGVIVSVVMTLLLTALIVALVALGNFFVDNPELFEPGEVEPGTELELGETAVVGDLEVTVTEVALDGTAEIAELGSDVPPEGQYVLVTADVANTSAEAVEVYFALYAAYESAGAVAYDEFTCAATFEGQAASVPSLEPGAEAAVSWCFDVPVDEVGDGRVVLSTSSLVGGNGAAWRDQ